MATTAPVTSSGLYADPREDWLALHTEEIIDPARPIVDPHHHLWHRGGLHYMIEEMAADAASGHNVVATVYVDCRSMYRANGAGSVSPRRRGRVRQRRRRDEPPAAATARPRSAPASSATSICLLGDGAKPVLEAEIVAGNGRFRGIRHSSAWDAEPEVAGMYATRPQGPAARSDLPQGLCLPRAARAQLRRLAVSSADRRTRRSRPRLS